MYNVHMCTFDDTKLNMKIHARAQRCPKEHIRSYYNVCMQWSGPSTSTTKGLTYSGLCVW